MEGEGITGGLHPREFRLQVRALRHKQELLTLQSANE
jgi:hypothetical protein